MGEQVVSILRLSHVSKFFGRTLAAQNVSFGISQNETMALLGGNGAGKTTVFNMIRGELKPDFGNIHLEVSRCCISHGRREFR
jgi:ABC-type branched-subunit amino acid transport system ATPase component